MPLSSTLPTYATLEPKIRAWATHRQIISPDGRPLLGTTQGQCRKTMEEIGEAQLERRKLAKSKAMRLQLFPLGLIVEGEGVLDRRLDRRLFDGCQGYCARYNGARSRGNMGTHHL